MINHPAGISRAAERNNSRGKIGDSSNSTTRPALCCRNRALGLRRVLLRADGSTPGERGKSLPNGMASRSAYPTGTRVPPPGAPGICLVCGPGPRAPALDHLVCLPSLVSPTRCQVTMSRLLLQICTGLLALIPIATGIVTDALSGAVRGSIPWRSGPGTLMGADRDTAEALCRLHPARAGWSTAIHLLATPGCPVGRHTVIGGSTHAARSD